MGFPHADTGVEDFPAVDAGLADFPGPDVGFEDFPPAPVMLVYADVSFTLTPAVVWAVLPWRTADVAFSVTPAAAPVASVVLEAAAGLVMTPIAAIIPDELFPVTTFTMSPAAEVEHASVVGVPVGLSMFPGMAEVPVAVVTADAITTMTVTAAVEIAGVIGAAAGLSMSPAAAPVACIDADADVSFTLSPAGEDLEVVTFRPSRMVKSGSTSAFSTSASQITGWAADTAGYPGSSVSSNDLVVQSDADGVTLSASIRFSATLGGRTITLRILLDSVQVATSGAVSVASGGSGTVVNASVTGVTVDAGSLIRVTAQASQAGMISAADDPASYVLAYLP